VGAEAGPPPVHSALASVYAHVTAPLRRLADRFANEIVLAASGGRVAPSWAVEALAALPDLMQDANRHAAAVERAVIDLMEAVVLRGLVGERLRGTIVDSDDDRATVQLQDPPVVASVAARGHTLGDEVVVEVRAAEPVSRKVVLEPV
jgi:exoribonuclease R